MSGASSAGLMSCSEKNAWICDGASAMFMKKKDPCYIKATLTVVHLFRGHYASLWCHLDVLWCHCVRMMSLFIYHIYIVVMSWRCDVILVMTFVVVMSSWSYGIMMMSLWLHYDVTVSLWCHVMYLFSDWTAGGRMVTALIFLVLWIWFFFDNYTKRFA